MPTKQGYGSKNWRTIGLDYYNARYDDAQLGQFTSADSAGQGGLNRYGYVAGNPETYTDPSGHMQCATCGGGGGGGDNPPPPSGNGGPCITDNNCPTDPPPPPPPPGGGKPPKGNSPGGQCGGGGPQACTSSGSQSYCSKECQQYAECQGDGSCAARQIALDAVYEFGKIALVATAIGALFAALAATNAENPVLLFAFTALAKAFAIIAAVAGALALALAREGGHELAWFTQSNIDGFSSAIGNDLHTVLGALLVVGDILLFFPTGAAIGVGIIGGGVASVLELSDLAFANINEQDAAIYNPDISSNQSYSPGRVVTA